MPSEKDKSLLKSSDYEIKGNSIRAFYDKRGKLVFVLDSTVSKIKPNVLLVISSYGDRKWDDVLSNDYGMDLELVRPKKDNKYQKLDIEYDGLVVYDNLIRAYDNGDNVKQFLADLDDFRAMSVRRSAQSRLDASTTIAENTRETIERTNDTIVELEAKIKATRSKITTLRRSVGKEPTKQSAAKILRAEAQLDVLTGKLERAKKRLENANKRLLTAEEDIEAARQVLELVGNVDDKKFKTVETVKPEPDTDMDDEFSDEEFSDEEDYDADVSDDENEEIKPLFDKDPEIMDENIAFKPIEFDEKFKEDDDTVAEPVKNEPEKPEPMSFEPPKPIMDTIKLPDDNDDEDVKLDDVFSDTVSDEVKYEKDTGVQEDSESVLDSLKTVDEPTEADVVDDTEIMDTDTEPVLEHEEIETEIVDNGEVAGVDTAINVTPVPEQPIVDNNPAPIENVVRPVSPLQQQKPIVQNVPQNSENQHKPNLLYYVLLLVLIALSVFTLWLYQRSNVSGNAVPGLVSDNTPVLVAESGEQADEQADKSADVAKTDEQTQEDEDPFVASGDSKEATEDVNTVNVVGDVLNKVSVAADIKKPEPVVVEEESQAEPEPEAEEEPVAEEKTAEKVEVNKPEYKVTQEKVFTDDGGEQSDVVGGDLCEGDVAPDANGCCPGETYSTLNGMNVCCPNDGGDCFPPMF